MGRRSETPVVKDSGGRFGFKLISAVSPKGDMRFHFIKKRMDSELFIQFLQKLQAGANRPILLTRRNYKSYLNSKNDFMEAVSTMKSLQQYPPG